jgi:hypothetical protein
MAVRTRLHAADRALVGNVIPGDKNPTIYVIAAHVITNMVQADGMCQNGSGTARRKWWAIVWIPGVSVGATGTISPARLQRLGEPRPVELEGPALPKSELVVHPGIGVGPDRLGASYSGLRRELGPPLYGAITVDQNTPTGVVYKGSHRLWFALGSASVAAVPDRHGRVGEIFFSQEVLLAGHHLSDGPAVLRRALPGWEMRNCGDSQLLVHRDYDNIKTSLLYDLGRFETGEIGRTVAAPPCHH